MSSPRKNPDGSWTIRWRVGGRGSKRRQKTFRRKSDAETYLREVQRRKEMGQLVSLDLGNQTVEELALQWWANYATPNLADHTLDKYQRVLAAHVTPALRHYRVHEITAQVLMDFRAGLERQGVGRDSVRVALVVLQAMFRQAVRWGWTQVNPVQYVEKPSGKRERAVVCLSPDQIESVRGALLQDKKAYAASIVSLLAYAGLRFPEEVLALQVRHIRARTVLVEQRNIRGETVAGQKVKGLPPRAVGLTQPVRQDIAEYLMGLDGVRQDAPLFPRADGQFWRHHDVGNWRSRVWHPARVRARVGLLPPYDLRHAFASLQIRAGVSIPELAEQMGHSPQMTVSTYTHVIQDLRGEPTMSAEDQILKARGRLVDVSGSEATG